MLRLCPCPVIYTQRCIWFPRRGSGQWMKQGWQGLGEWTRKPKRARDLTGEWTGMPDPQPSPPRSFSQADLCSDASGTKPWLCPFGAGTAGWTSSSWPHPWEQWAENWMESGPSLPPVRFVQIWDCPDLRPALAEGQVSRNPFCPFLDAQSIPFPWPCPSSDSEHPDINNASFVPATHMVFSV